MNSIILVGGGGHAKVIISILRKLGSFSILGYTALEDGGDLMGVPFLGADSEITQLANGIGDLNAVLAIGQVGLGNLRSSIWKRLRELPISFPSIVSPKAIVNEVVSISEGTVVMDGVVINSSTHIGHGVILNTNSTIEHDVVLGDWVHVAPGATISGGVRIGDFSMIGAGATVIEETTIGANCMIGAGATVINDLSDAGVYVGCPARRIKT